MINGLLTTLKDYKGMHQGLDVAIDYLLSHDLNALPVGKTIVDDALDITINKLVYVGKEMGNAFPEEHAHHLDMQIVLKGHEIAYFDYLKEEYYSHIHTPYNEEKDVIKFDVDLRHMVIMDQENFTLFTPSDVHLPSIKIDDNEITKLVIKVRI
jgi:YhcH/YjgK/YiaL family protein